MISIIVPVYKTQKYLRQCVDSILAQTYMDLEVILIDDGSPDKSGDICDEYAKKDSRVRCFHTENKGLSAARNLGIQFSKGEYVGFVDSDDWIEPDMYELLIKKADYYNADISMCGFWYESDNLKQEVGFNEGYYKGHESLIALIEYKINNHIWNKIYRKNLFTLLSFLDNHYYEDINILHLLLAKADLTIVNNNPKYHYRQRDDSIIKNHTAKNLVDYAQSYLDRYYFFKETNNTLFINNEVQILKSVAQGISRLWRWWHKCNQSEKMEFKEAITFFRQFSKDHFPLLGYKCWPSYLNFCLLFMRSSSRISFALLFCANQTYRKVRPKRVIIHE